MGTIAQTWLERGIQQGVQQGVQQGLERGLESGRRLELLSGIELALELRYGTTGLALMPEIKGITQLETLSAIRDGIRTAPTPADLRRIYA